MFLFRDKGDFGMENLTRIGREDKFGYYTLKIVICDIEHHNP